MQATGTVRAASATRGGVWLWVIALLAGMLLAGAGGYLARGSSSNAGVPGQVQATAVPTAAGTVNEPQPIDGLQP